MRIVGAVMKYLKIENNKGFYLADSEDWKPIDQLNKEDMLKLIDLLLTCDFEMDEFDKEKMGNPAHQIIYKHIYEKLDELNRNKKRFQDESASLYKEALEKYSTDNHA